MFRGFFALLLTALLFVSSLGFVAYRLQKPDFVIEQARKANLYGRLTDNLESLLSAMNVEALPLPSQDIADIVKTSVDGERFYDFAAKFLTAAVPYFTGTADRLTFQYDLTNVKQKLSENLNAKMKGRYDNLPTCQANQLRGWNFEGGLPECRLTQSSNSADISRQITAVSGELTQMLPDTFAMDKSTPRLEAGRNIVTRLYNGINYAWIATLVVLVLMIAFWRGRAFWSLSGAFVLVGLIEIGFSLIAWDWIAKNIADLLGGSEAQALTPIAVSVATPILKVFQTILGNISIVLLVIGVVCFILGFVFRAPKTILATDSKRI